MCSRAISKLSERFATYIAYAGEPRAIIMNNSILFYFKVCLLCMLLLR